MTDFAYSPMFPTGTDTTDYELVTTDHVKMVELDGEPFLKVEPEGLRRLAQRAFTDVSHLLRSSHLGAQLFPASSDCMQGTLMRVYHHCCVVHLLLHLFTFLSKRSAHIVLTHQCGSQKCELVPCCLLGFAEAL